MEKKSKSILSKRISTIFDTAEIDIDFGCSFEQIIDSELYSKYYDSNIDHHNKYKWIYFKPIKILNDTYKFSVGLYDNRFTTLTFTVIDDKYGSSWGDWSETKELSRKSYHEEIIAKMFNVTNCEAMNGFKYSGLFVNSIYDSKASSSYVVIKVIN